MDERSTFQYVEQISVSNFRGFGLTESVIEFAIPKDNKLGLNIIVGENCSGKSTVLELINLSLTTNHSLDSGLLLRNSMYNSCEPINIKAKFNNGTIIIRSIEQSAAIKRESKISFPDSGSYILHIPSKKSINTTILNNNPGSIDAFITNHGIANNGNLNRRNNNQGYQFLELLLSIVTDQEKRKKFNEIFNKFLPGFVWNVARAEESEYGYIVKFKDIIGESTFEGVGDGLITILYIAIGIFSLETSENLKILTIDEPEVSLHPQLIKKLIEVIEEYSRKYQIFIATHSTYLINWNAIVKGAKLIRMVKDKQNNRLEPYYIDSTILNKSTISQSHPHTFGLDANEVFFLNDKVILVEGQEDVTCFRKIINEIGRDVRNYYFYGWGSNGASNMEFIAKILRKLGYKKVVMILDGDAEGLNYKEKYEKKFSKYLVKNISTDDIRDKEMIFQHEIINRVGICDKNFRIKHNFSAKYKNEMVKLFDDIERYFTD